MYLQLNYRYYVDDLILFVILFTSCTDHFCNENHWVVSSFLDGVIHLYDSLPSSKMSAGLEEQLARLYGHLECSLDDGRLTIHNVLVQVQQGTSDCGLFAVALLLTMPL